MLQKALSMPRKRSATLTKLPQTPETWAVAPVLLRSWIAPPDEKPYRPTVILIMDLTNDFIMGGSLARIYRWAPRMQREDGTERS